jgi:hypothetical protein
VAAVDGLASKRTEHCTIGRDERRIRSQTQALQQRNRESRAAARRNSHSYARCLRGPKRLRIALTDFLRVRRQERAVNVNRDEPDRRVHGFSVPGALEGGRNPRHVTAILCGRLLSGYLVAMKWLGILLADTLLICPLMGQSIVQSGGESRAPAASARKPAIYLIGSVHNMHYEERYHYSLIDLQAQVLSVHPDVVCGEITPEAYNAPMEGNFPPEAAMLAEMAPAWGVRFIPADWRVSFAWQRRGEQQEAENKAQDTAVLDAQRQIQGLFEHYSGASLYDMISGGTYLALADHLFEEVIGENTPSDIAAGAWHERNRMIVENCLAGAGGARRIAFVFGSAHLPQLQRQLAARGSAAQIPARAFTPAGLGTMPSQVIARWQRNLANLEKIAAGTVTVSADARDKVKDTNRAPVLRGEIAIYQARQETR